MYSQRKSSATVKDRNHVIYVRDREYSMPYSPFPSQVPSIDDAVHIFDQLNAKLLEEAIEFDRLNGRDSSESKAAAVKAACSAYSSGRNKVELGYGQGYWDHYRFSETLFMSACNAVYENDTLMHIPGESIVKIRIVLAGELLNDRGDVLLSGPGGMISVHDATRDSEYYIKGGVETKFLVIHCKPDFPIQHFGLGFTEVPKPFEYFTKKKKDCDLCDSQFSLSSAIYRAASDVFDACYCPRGSVQNAYLFSKCLEISGLVIEGVTNTSSVSKDLVSLKSADIKRIHAARRILEDHFSDPPSVKDLAKTVGVNQTKLKSGFKAVTGSTISQFILNLRMERAMEMLLSNAVTISEVSYNVGYGYPANFAHAFKKHFGILPKDVRSR